MNIKKETDFWTGAMFFAIGSFAATVSLLNYSLGTLIRVGPGLFPTLIGSLLVAIGVALMARSFAVQGESLPNWRWGPVVRVTIALLSFGLLLDRAGLALSVIAMVFIATAPNLRTRFLETTALTAGLILFSWLVFIKGLNLPFRILPW